MQEPFASAFFVISMKYRMKSTIFTVFLPSDFELVSKINLDLSLVAVNIFLIMICWICLTLWRPTPQNGQKHSNNSSVNCLSGFDHSVEMALKGLKLSVQLVFSCTKPTMEAPLCKSTVCKICSKLTKKTAERRQMELFVKLFSQKFPKYVVLLTLVIFHTLFWCFHCYLWTSKRWQGKTSVMWS